MSNIKDKLIEIVAKVIKDKAAVVELSEVLLLTFDNFDNACEEIADSIIENLPKLLEDSEWVKLPCKVGDMVWFIVYDGRFGTDINVKQRIVNDISLDKIGVQIHSVRDKIVDANLWGYIGDTVFLTQAEADAELVERTGVNKNE